MAKNWYRQRRILFWLALLVYLITVSLYLANRYLELYLATSGQNGLDPITHRSTKVVPPKPKVAQSLPVKALIEVPFTVQAPFANWDTLHEEACEEASLMMLKYSISHQSFGSPTDVDKEIKDLISWEGSHDFKISVTLAELAEIADGYYQMPTGRIIEDLTLEKIKAEIAAGRPVIVPAAGRNLPNPHFTPPGPVYHMLVVKGYTSSEFITNDPGVREGKDFHYSYDSLMNAIHDWDPGNIINGAKRGLVFD